MWKMTFPHCSLMSNPLIFYRESRRSLGFTVNRFKCETGRCGHTGSCEGQCAWDQKLLNTCPRHGSAILVCDGERSGLQWAETSLQWVGTGLQVDVDQYFLNLCDGSPEG